MPHYEFTLFAEHTIRSTGDVFAVSLEDAIGVIEHDAPVTAGDRLLIGVNGFPPMLYECAEITYRDGALGPRWRVARATSPSVRAAA